MLRRSHRILRDRVDGRVHVPRRPASAVAPVAPDEPGRLGVADRPVVPDPARHRPGEKASGGTERPTFMPAAPPLASPVYWDRIVLPRASRAARESSVFSCRNSVAPSLVVLDTAAGPAMTPIPRDACRSPRTVPP